MPGVSGHRPQAHAMARLTPKRRLPNPEWVRRQLRKAGWIPPPVDRYAKSRGPETWENWELYRGEELVGEMGFRLRPAADTAYAIYWLRLPASTEETEPFRCDTWREFAAETIARLLTS